MKMTELLRYGLPPEIIRLWQEQESEHLLPLQELTVKQHGLFDGGNLLIQAPTTSGKTFIGEMAAVHAALQRKKVVYLVPLKALAEEKWVDFRKKYQAYGIKTIIATRDRREFDRDLEEGNFTIAVAVYEKWAQVLVRRPERMREVSLAVVDELELLSDPDRGGMAELLLTRMLMENVRLVGLSAVLGHPERLAQWMEAALVLFERRPVELRYGVLHEGRFRYRTYNDFAEEEETLGSDVGEDALAAQVGALAEKGEPSLVFVKDKYATRRGARMLAEHLEIPAAEEAVAALKSLEPTHAAEELAELMQNGVAYHNADLSPEERRIVEQAFRRGEIRAIVATTTLAVGLNLPAQNVFITAEKWQYDNRFGLPWKTPILRAEYENMGGRAGRYGSGRSFGRSILVAASPFDEETLWRRYVEGEREPVQPQLGREPLEDHIVRLVAAGACQNEAQLRTFFERTPTGRWVWADTLSPEEIALRVRNALNQCLDAGLIVPAYPHETRLEATPFGWTAAAKGISVGTAQALAAWVRESETRHWGALDLLIAATMTPDGRMMQLALTTREYDHAGYLGRLKRRTDNEELHADTPLNRLRNSEQALFFEDTRALKAALLVHDWIDEQPVYALEETYQTWLGQIRNAADQLSWLLDAASAIAEAFGCGEAFVRRIATLAEQTARGLREETLPLARNGVLHLDRAACIALAAQGYAELANLAQATPDTLRRWMALADARQLIAWAADRPAATVQKPPECPILIIDDAQPDRITVAGTTVPLQDKQFQLIRLLGENTGECVSYDRIYEQLWGDQAVEPNQMHFQKKRLLAAIAEAAPEHHSLVRTIPKRGFILDLKPEHILLQTTREPALL